MPEITSYTLTVENATESLPLGYEVYSDIDELADNLLLYSSGDLHLNDYHYEVTTDAGATLLDCDSEHIRKLLSTALSIELQSSVQPFIENSVQATIDSKTGFIHSENAQSGVQNFVNEHPEDPSKPSIVVDDFYDYLTKLCYT